MSYMQSNFEADTTYQRDVATFLRSTEILLSTRVNESKADYNFLTVAGQKPSHAEFSALGAFSCTCNWNVCYAYDAAGVSEVFDPANMRFLCVFYTDDDVPVFLNNGRLWADYKSRRLAIAFEDEGLHLKLLVDVRGKITVREKTHPFDPNGYEAALKLLRKRKGFDDSKRVVLTALGPVPCTMDMTTFQRAIEAAARAIA